ncbi:MULTISPECIES: ead/Ea22-like family protein [Klebsiella pneumoniae complex]|uniref:ead/Ea22-like family protein n=1 Tax=Klebsiella pneumoniae complex TaxID=3390273 RepID=UPI001FAB7FE5|nr:MULTISPECIES: ead/Ea22-like family protein [Klebsiella]MCI7910454.1 ead/Ea22-like family protein [Klebsiella pneumoniae]
MTTDITELAQRMKAAAEKATPGEWWADEVKNEGCYGSGDDCVEGFTSYAIYGSDGQTLFDSLNSDAACICEEYDGEGHVAWDETAQRNAEFIALANPANVLALVEALEKAQQRIAELEEAEQKLCAANITLDARAELAERQLAEMESRTVKLPAELYTIGELIRTQDNRITDQPMFVVFQKREIIGSDEHSPSRICWVWDGEEVSELRAKRLEALYQDGRDTRGYDRYAMQEVDKFVTACFTEHGCKDYLRQNGHNLRLPYIYACGSFRNNEYQLVRNWLAGIKVEAE